MFCPENLEITASPSIERSIRPDSTYLLQSLEWRLQTVEDLWPDYLDWLASFLNIGDAGTA